MWEIGIHEYNEVSSGMFNSMDVGSACQHICISDNCGITQELKHAQSFWNQTCMLCHQELLRYKISWRKNELCPTHWIMHNSSNYVEDHQYYMQNYAHAKGKKGKGEHLL